MNIYTESGEKQAQKQLLSRAEPGIKEGDRNEGRKKAGGDADWYLSREDGEVRDERWKELKGTELEKGEIADR